MSKSWFNASVLNMHSKYKNRLLIKFIYTFLYKYKYTNVFLKYKYKYSHIVYIVYQTNNYKHFFLGYLALTKQLLH